MLEAVPRGWGWPDRGRRWSVLVHWYEKNFKLRLVLLCYSFLCTFFKIFNLWFVTLEAVNRIIRSYIDWLKRCLELRVLVWALQKQVIRFIVCRQPKISKCTLWKGDSNTWKVDCRRMKNKQYLSAIHGVFVQSGNYFLKNLS